MYKQKPKNHTFKIIIIKKSKIVLIIYFATEFVYNHCGLIYINIKIISIKKKEKKKRKKLFYWYFTLQQSSFTLIVGLYI